MLGNLFITKNDSKAEFNWYKLHIESDRDYSL